MAYLLEKGVKYISPKLGHPAVHKEISAQGGDGQPVHLDARSPIA
jgi:hypothetical protein